MLIVGIWALFAIVMFVVSLWLGYKAVLAWIAALPYVLLIWFSWSILSAFGFLGYLGILALIILPIAFVCDLALDDHEYFGTGISATILIGIAALYGLIAHWSVAWPIIKYGFAITFFVGCIAVIIDAAKGEKENA